MKLSLNWIGDYVDLSDVSTDELVRRLTLSVCEVEGVERVFDHLDMVRVARVESLARHPDADRLNVCQVKDGKRRHQIVCGAPNVREGMLAPLAVIGARLPGSDGEFLEIKAARLRGVESNGMLCSPAELGLGALTGEVDGLIDLETLPGLDDPAALVDGTPLGQVLPLKDTVLDIDNKSITHRPDLWSHFGFAREIAAIFGRRLIYDPARQRAPLQPKTDAKLPSKRILIAPGAAKAYYGRALGGVRIVPAPLWMQARLLNVGQRPINNVVDASNYVMLEIGQPNHTFDLRKLRADAISVTTAGAKSVKISEFTTLDDTRRQIPPDAILILDGATPGKSTPVALGGIMGGLDSGVADDTSELFLESATFPREKIRPTIAKLGLRTDSAQRFEKGQDPANARPALARLAELIRLTCPDLRQGKLTGSSPEKERRNKITVSLGFLQNRLGFPIAEKLARDILTRLNFELQAQKKAATARTPGDTVFKITAPTYRSQYDITIPEDIVEELGRIYGYDNVVPQAPTAPIQPTPQNRERKLGNRIKNFLAQAAGYNEVYGYSFASGADNLRFAPLRPFSNDGAPGKIAALPLRNPVFADRPELRLSQLPGLLRQAAGNQDRFDDVRLFEYGRIYYKNAGEVDRPVLADESKRFSLLHLPPDSGKQGAALDERAEFQALLELRAVLTRLFGTIAYDGAVYFRLAPNSDAPVWLHPGAALEIRASDGDALLGQLGILHPAVQEAYDLKRPAVLADLDFGAIFALADGVRLRVAYRAPSVFPDSRFEVSLTMDELEGTHRPLAVIEALGLPEIREIRLLTIYRGAPLPEGKKSVSYELRAARDGGTLTGEELQSLLDRVVAALQAAGFPLR